jgi:hypothetical protein
LVYEVSRAEELAERRREHSADHAGLDVEKHHARHVLAALGLVAKQVDAAELRMLSPQYSPPPPMLCSSRTTSLYLVPIWLPH